MEQERGKTIQVRHFMEKDINFLREKEYPEMSDTEIANTISLWNRNTYEGRYFERFAVVLDSKIIGHVSLLKTGITDTVSVGIEIFPAFQRQGYGSAAEKIILAYAKKCGYKTASAQVRVDNEGSISLHKKLGFSPKSRFINKKGNAVYHLEKEL